VVDAEWCDNGPGWIAIMLASSDHVLALTPSASFPEPVKVGVIGPCDPVSDAHFEVRAFFPAPTGIFEDPVTGSLNAGLAQWLFATGRVDGDRYVAAQGTVLGRTGRIHVERDADGTIWVGGDTRVCLAGTIDV
jgi:predicted PhzF superfamily epimerase YddE/YHI9